MIVLDGKEINTLFDAYLWLREAWMYEPYNIYFEEDGSEELGTYSAYISIEPTRGTPDTIVSTISNLEEFKLFVG